MMQVIRHGIFETNSSSSHSFSLEKAGQNDSDYKKTEEEIDEEAEEYSKEHNVKFEDARYEVFLDSLRESSENLASAIGKLIFCESLIVYLGENKKDFDPTPILKRVKELLSDQKNLYSYRFFCDRKILPMKYGEEVFFDMETDYLIECAKNLFFDLSNVDVIAYRVRDIVTDVDVEIRIEGSYDY